LSQIQISKQALPLPQRQKIRLTHLLILALVIPPEAWHPGSLKALRIGATRLSTNLLTKAVQEEMILRLIGELLRVGRSRCLLIAALVSQVLLMASNMVGEMFCLIASFDEFQFSLLNRSISPLKRFRTR
jgi:hypothetical protein